MTNEYKIIKEKNQTRFILEDASSGGASAGASSAGSFASLALPLGNVKRRSQKESEQIKTRNPGVPALAKKTGSGAHKTKTKYQRRPKHQKPLAEDSDTNLKFANYIRDMFVKLTGVDPNSEEEDPDYRREPEEAIEIIAGRLSEKFPLFRDKEGNPDVNAVRKFLSQHSNFKEGFREPDHEISMAKNELRMIYRSALELFQLIKHYSEMEGLEAWQQSKITKAADYLYAVLKSISGEVADKGVAEDSEIPMVTDPETGRKHPDYGNTGIMRDLAAAAQKRKPQTPTEPNSNDLSKYNDFPETNRDPWKPIMIGEPSWANIPKSLEIWARRKGIHRDIDIKHNPEGKIWTIKGKSGYGHDTEYTYRWAYDFKNNQFEPVKSVDESVTGPKNCWPGHRKVGTQPGTGKNKGKRVNKCKEIKKEDTYTETLLSKLDQMVNEKAPPGAKYKRMAKHIKASYKGSGLDKDEIAQRAFGATWKAAKQAKK